MLPGDWDREHVTEAVELAARFTVVSLSEYPESLHFTVQESGETPETVKVGEADPFDWLFIRTSAPEGEDVRLCENYRATPYVLSN